MLRDSGVPRPTVRIRTDSSRTVTAPRDRCQNPLHLATTRKHLGTPPRGRPVGAASGGTAGVPGERRRAVPSRRLPRRWAEFCVRWCCGCASSAAPCRGGVRGDDRLLLPRFSPTGMPCLMNPKAYLSETLTSPRLKSIFCSNTRTRFVISNNVVVRYRRWSSGLTGPEEELKRAARPLFVLRGVPALQGTASAAPPRPRGSPRGAP